MIDELESLDSINDSDIRKEFEQGEIVNSNLYILCCFACPITKILNQYSPYYFMSRTIL
jgi:hypothetical protein